jgi:hypothetical protein
LASSSRIDRREREIENEQGRERETEKFTILLLGLYVYKETYHIRMFILAPLCSNNKKLEAIKACINRLDK